jgi:hypothetical protein
VSLGLEKSKVKKKKVGTAIFAQRMKSAIYRVIHERGISELLFAATHYTHCNNILISNFENNYL